MANTVSASYPEVWSKYMALTLDAKSIMMPLVNRSVEADLAKEGDVVHVQKWGSLTTSTYTPGSDNTVSNFSLTDATLTLDQLKYVQVVIDKTETAMSHLDLVKGAMGRMSIAMAQTIDDRLLGHSSDVDSGNIIGSASLPITLTKDNIYEYFVEAGRLLDGDNVERANRHAVIDPDTFAILVASGLLTHATAKGDEVVRNNAVGRFANFDIHVSNRIATASGVKDLMFFVPEFIDLAVRISPDKIEQYKPEKQFGTGLKVLGLYGSTVFNDTAGVVLKKAA